MDCALNMEEDRQTFALKLTSTCESEMCGMSSAHPGSLLSARSHIIDTMHCYPPPSREQGLAQIPVKNSPMNHNTLVFNVFGNYTFLFHRLV